MSKKKIGIIAGVIVVVLAIGGIGLYFGTQTVTSGNSENRVYVEQVSSIMNVNMGLTNRYNGVVESQAAHEVHVDNGRTIETIHVEVGDVVKEGQRLVTYDISDLQLQIDQANLELESINNDIQNYVTQIQYKTQLYYTSSEADRYIIQTEINNMYNAITQREYDVESKQLEIDKLKKQMGNASLNSEVAGTVKEINKNGIDANGNSAAFMTILQSGEYRVKGTIDEQNIWSVSEGQPVLLRSRVDEEKTWNGTIELIDMENPQQNNNNYYYGGSDSAVMASKYPFYIALEDASGLILGQHVYIELNQGQEMEKEGLWLYGYYIMQEETGAYVWTSNSRNRLEKCKVELGEYNAELDEYQILSGITEEDFITWPMEGLYEGVTTVTDMAEENWNPELPEGEEVLPEDMEMLPGDMEISTEMMDMPVMEEVQE